MSHTEKTSDGPAAVDIDALIERINALADCSYWANAGWDIPGDATQVIGRLAVQAAAALVQLREENARLRKSLFANDQWNGSRVPVGWRCPDCGGVNAPEVRGCPCHGNKTLRERVSTP